LLFLFSDLAGLVSRGNITGMGLALVLCSSCTGSCSFSNLAIFRFGSVDVFTERAIQNGDFARTRDTTTVSDELVVWCALVDIAKLILRRGNVVCGLDGTLGKKIAADD
jgi:hypothetical protein